MGTATRMAPPLAGRGVGGRLGGYACAPQNTKYTVVATFVVEKETRVREVLKIQGVSTAEFIGSWYLSAVAALLAQGQVESVRERGGEGEARRRAALAPDLRLRLRLLHGLLALAVGAARLLCYPLRLFFRYVVFC
eukprot:SAG11_NODE_7065_length_1199_cov_1.900000_1_plen_136_part_00